MTVHIDDLSAVGGGYRKLFCLAECDASRLLHDTDFEDRENVEPGSEARRFYLDKMGAHVDVSAAETGCRMEVYRVFRGRACADLAAGRVLAGRVTLGLDRPFDSQGGTYKQNEYCFLDQEGNVLAVSTIGDHNARRLSLRIGETADAALLFCDKSMWSSYIFLYVVLIWNLDAAGRRDVKADAEALGAHAESYFIEARNAASEVGRYVANEARVEQRGSGCLSIGNTELCDIPSGIDIVAHGLMATGYPSMTVRAMYCGNVAVPLGVLPIVRVDCRNVDELYLLRKIREGGAVDLMADGIFERYHLDVVGRPYDVPFGPADAVFSEVPVPHRKNPALELRADGVLLERAAYSERERYKKMAAHVGMTPVWSALHYADDDAPYLDIVYENGSSSGSLSCFIEG